MDKAKSRRERISQRLSRARHGDKGRTSFGLRSSASDIEVQEVIDALRGGEAPLPDAVNRAIRAAKVSDEDACFEILEMVDPRVFDEASGRIAVEMFAAANDWAAALAAFEALGARRQRANAAALAHALHALVELARPAEALSLYERLLGAPLPRKGATAAAQLGPGVEKALQCCEDRLRLDARHHEAGMAACRACGQAEAGSALLRGAHARGAPLGAAVYEHALPLFEAAGMWQLCLWALQVAMRTGVNLAPSAHMAAIAALGAAGEPERASTHLEELGDGELGAKPTAAVFNATLTALLRNGKREEAVSLYPAISQVHIREGLACSFSYTAFAEAVGNWADAIERVQAQVQPENAIVHRIVHSPMRAEQSASEAATATATPAAGGGRLGGAAGSSPGGSPGGSPDDDDSPPAKGERGAPRAGLMRSGAGAGVSAKLAKVLDKKLPTLRAAAGLDLDALFSPSPAGSPKARSKAGAADRPSQSAASPLSPEEADAPVGTTSTPTAPTEVVPL